MKLMNIRYFLGLMGMVSLGLTACTNDADSGSAPEEGAIVFSAALQKPVTRSTESKWDGNEQVGIKIGSDVKTYKVTDANGTMTTDDQAPFQYTGTNLSVTAWCPMTDQPIDLTDQTTTRKLFDCDLLKSEGEATSKKVRLTFTHQMTRMKWVITGHEGYTDDQVKAAKVSFLGYGSVNYTDGTLTPAGALNAVIATANNTADGGNYGEAMMVPGEVWGQPLIKVEIGGNTYVYTPDKNNTADAAAETGVLKAGYWQTYGLSVTLKGLTVTMKSDAIGWNNTTYGDDQLADGKYKVTVPADLSSKEGYAISGVNEKGFVTDASRGFSITYKETNASGGIDIVSGNCDRTRTVNTDGTVTFTFSNVVSDIKLAYTGEYMEVGYYFYSDGTYGADYKADKTVGLIYKIGADATDDAVNYDGKLTKIHGYVVALADEEKPLKWKEGNGSLYGADYPEFGIGGGTTTKYIGYANTRYLVSKAGNGTSVPAAEAATAKNGGTVIKGTSGWYLPSHSQLKGLNTLAGRTFDGYSPLNGTYWDSSFDSDPNAYIVQFKAGGISSAEFYRAVDSEQNVRLILTF